MKTSPEGKANIILEGASFYRGSGLDHEIDFIAVSDHKIIALGKKHEMSQYVDENTEILSFTKDNLITAGFHDNHVHLIQAGILGKYVNLYTSTSKEDAAKQVAEYAKSIPDEKWVMGVGFRMPTWEDPSLPTKETLDAVIPDRPVFLIDEELHAAWLNSKALEECGITKDTPTPKGGIIDRDEKGNPSGALLENAVALVAKHAYDFDDKTVKDLVTGYIDRAVKMGITSVSDMTPYLSLDLSFSDVYLDMVRKGELKIRINAARNLFEDIETFNAMRKRADEEGKGLYRVPFMKQFVDGTPGNYTGFLLDCYSDNPDTKGAPTIDIEKMNKAIEIATENNVSVRLHSCGDASCRAALDAYEKALRKYPESASRHMVEHLELVDPDDIPRFADLGVIASIQPEHLACGTTAWKENCYPERLGSQRERYTWPFKQIKDAGAPLACGSDCPVVEGNPFWGIYVGNTRKFYDGLPKEGWNPQSSLSIAELLDGYTMGAAYAEHREHELGTLEVGKLADITVLDRNILNMPADTAIRDTNALLTMVNGNIVYADACVERGCCHG